VRAALGASAWLRGGVESRLRIEHLANDFRAGATGDARALSLRTSLAAEATWRSLVVGVEVLDARAWATDNTAVNNTLVNPVDVLQAYLGLRRADVFQRGDVATLSIGRFTMNVGNRRLIARNEFRNTINNFTGVHATWRGASGRWGRAFVVLPVLRLPEGSAALRDNDPALDHTNTHALLWGLLWGAPVSQVDAALEAYVFGLHEGDGPDTPSSNRQLATAGLRLLRAPRPGRLDLEAELSVQVGRSRATTRPEDVRDLDHRAAAIHLAVGYTLPTAWPLRASLFYDQGSGDGSPDDGVQGRFDTLFGARRFELTPTGLFGALARSNLRSPGVRVEVVPARRLDGFVTWRPAWLAAARDAWTSAGLRDRTGASGTFVGHHLETRARWQVLPGNLAVEVGAACLVRGAFARNAPGGNEATSVLVYAQVTTTL